jgi:hypothetical protein
MENKICIFTFSYDNWALATTIEIIASKLVSGDEIVWIDWTGEFVRKHVYPVASKRHIHQTKKRIKKSELLKDLMKLALNGKFRYQDSVGEQINHDYPIEEIAEAVAYLELVSAARDSTPDKNSHKDLLEMYKDTYKQTYVSAIKLLQNIKPIKVFLYNGRFLQERAVWEACKNLNIEVNFFEKFNSHWFDKYFIFEDSTHSPNSRSNIMSIFSKKKWKVP